MRATWPLILGIGDNAQEAPHHHQADPTDRGVVPRGNQRRDPGTARKLPNQTMQLTVIASLIEDANGHSLAGTSSGQPGTNFTATLNSRGVLSRSEVRATAHLRGLGRGIRRLDGGRTILHRSPFAPSARSGESCHPARRPRSSGPRGRRGCAPPLPGLSAGARAALPAWATLTDSLGLGASFGLPHLEPVAACLKSARFLHESPSANLGNPDTVIAWYAR